MSSFETVSQALSEQHDGQFSTDKLERDKRSLVTSWLMKKWPSFVSCKLMCKHWKIIKFV